MSFPYRDNNRNHNPYHPNHRGSGGHVHAPSVSLSQTGDFTPGTVSGVTATTSFPAAAPAPDAPQQQQSLLQQQVQDLQQQLEQKDESLWDVSATLATVQAESTVRLQQVQQESQSKIAQLEQQVRQLQHEAQLLLVQKQTQQLQQAKASSNAAASATNTTRGLPQHHAKRPRSSMSSMPTVVPPPTPQPFSSSRSTRPSSSSSFSVSSPEFPLPETPLPIHKEKEQPQDDPPPSPETTPTNTSSKPITTTTSSVPPATLLPPTATGSSFAGPSWSSSLSPLSLPHLLLQSIAAGTITGNDGDSVPESFDENPSWSRQHKDDKNQRRQQPTTQQRSSSRPRNNNKNNTPYPEALQDLYEYKPESPPWKQAPHQQQHYQDRFKALLTPLVRVAPAGGNANNVPVLQLEQDTLLCLLQEFVLPVRLVQQQESSHVAIRSGHSSPSTPSPTSSGTWRGSYHWILTLLPWLHQALLWARPETCRWIVQREQRENPPDVPTATVPTTHCTPTTTTPDMWSGESSRRGRTLRVRSSTLAKEVVSSNQDGSMETTPTPTGSKTTFQKDWRRDLVDRAIQVLCHMALFQFEPYVTTTNSNNTQESATSKEDRTERQRQHQAFLGAVTGLAPFHVTGTNNDEEADPYYVRDHDERVASERYLLQLQLSVWALRILQTLLGHVVVGEGDANSMSHDKKRNQALIRSWLERLGMVPDHEQDSSSTNDAPEGGHLDSENTEPEDTSLLESTEASPHSSSPHRFHHNLLLFLLRRAMDLQIAQRQLLPNGHDPVQRTKNGRRRRRLLGASSSAAAAAAFYQKSKRRILRRTASLATTITTTETEMTPESRLAELQQQHVDRVFPVDWWLPQAPWAIHVSTGYPHDMYGDHDNGDSDEEDETNYAYRKRIHAMILCDLQHERNHWLVQWMTAAMALIRQTWTVSRSTSFSSSEHWYTLWMMAPQKRARYVLATVLDWTQLVFLPQLKQWGNLRRPVQDQEYENSDSNNTEEEGPYSVGSAQALSALELECVWFITNLLQEPQLGGHALVCTQMGAMSLPLRLPTNHNQLTTDAHRTSAASSTSNPLNLAPLDTSALTPSYSAIGVLSQVLFELVQRQHVECEQRFYERDKEEKEEEQTTVRGQEWTRLRDAIVGFYDGLLRITQFNRQQQDALDEQLQQQQHVKPISPKNRSLTFLTQTMECQDLYTSAVSVLLTAFDMEQQEHPPIPSSSSSPPPPAHAPNGDWKSWNPEHDTVSMRRTNRSYDESWLTTTTASSRLVPVSSGIAALLRLQLEELELDQEEQDEEEQEQQQQQQRAGRR